MTDELDVADCGNTIAAGATKYANPATACNMACDGNSAEACGGSNALTLYSANQVKLSPPIVDPGPPGWHSLGCYTDSGASRALTAAGASSGGSAALTVGLCTLACGQGGYSYAGVEYAGECCKLHVLSQALESSNRTGRLRKRDIERQHLSTRRCLIVQYGLQRQFVRVLRRP